MKNPIPVFAVALTLVMQAPAQLVVRDETFNNNLPTSTGGSVRSIAVQSDQKIIFCGEFNNYNGTSFSKLNRLLKTGEQDPTFTAATINGIVNAVAIQPWDNKIIIAGSLTSVNAVSRGGIARLNTNGSLDLSFNPGTGIGGSYDGDMRIWSVAIKDSADATKRRIIIGGHFETYNGTSIGSRGGVAQLMENGSRDLTYNPQVTSGPVYALKLDSSKRILVGGEFWQVAGNNVRRIARLREDGSWDNSFQYIGWGPHSSVTSIDIDRNNKIIIGGWFTQFSGNTASGIARLNSNGTYDATFDTGTGLANGTSPYTNTTEARTVCVTRENKILVGGNFTNFNGTACGNIVAVNENGTLHASYDFSDGFNSNLMTIALHETFPGDFRILAGGFFDSYNHYTQGSIMRLEPLILLSKSSIAGSAARRNKNVFIQFSVKNISSTEEVNITRSDDGFHFNTINTSRLSSFASNREQYQYEDVNAPLTALYYRVEIKNRASSAVMAVECETNTEIAVYPNPFSQSLFIRANPFRKTYYDISFFNAAGAKVFTQRMPAGMNLLSVSPGNLSDGVYQLVIHDAAGKIIDRRTVSHIKR